MANKSKSTIKTRYSKTRKKIARQGLIKTVKTGFSFKSVLAFIILALVVGALVRQFLFASTASLSNPTHFVDSYWSFPSRSGGYTSQDVTIRFANDGGSDGYYASMNGWLSGSPAYIGLQNNGSNPTGKIAIFSLWNAQAADGPQYAKSFGGEGVGYSVRINYGWVAGSAYRVKIAKIASDPSGDWWAGYVISGQTGATTYIGKIKARAGAGNLSNSVATFHERYSGPIASCSSLQASTVSFTSAHANGSVGALRRSDSTTPVCPGNRKIANIAGGYTSTIGGNIGSARPVTVTQTPENVSFRGMNYTFLVGGSNSYCPSRNTFDKGSGRKACRFDKPGNAFSLKAVPTSSTSAKQFCWLMTPTTNASTTVRLGFHSSRQSITHTVTLRKGAQNYCLTLAKESSNNAFDNTALARLITGKALVYGAGFK